MLQSDGDLRVSDLYSTDNGRRTTRTLAIVRFVNPVDPRLATSHRQIVDGASIGATLKSAGWRIEKRTLEICRTYATALPQLQGMRLEGSPPLAVHRYRFTVRRRGERVEYAEISEIHHPDYLEIADLRAGVVDRAVDYVESEGACRVQY